MLQFAGRYGYLVSFLVGSCQYRDNRVHLIGYTSESLIPQDELQKTIESIVLDAQLRNISSGVTGILFYQDGHFVQLLEGYQSALQDLLTRIRRDPRHQDLRVFLDAQILDRNCAEWSMVSVNLDRSSSLNHRLLPQIRDIYEKRKRVDADSFSQTLRDFLSIPEISVELFG